MILTHKAKFVVRIPPSRKFVNRMTTWTGIALLLLAAAASTLAQASRFRLHVGTNVASGATVPAKQQSVARPRLVWVDTDIGDDLDDAFALALLLRSPQVRIIGISTTFGDTELRARLLDHFLASSHLHGIPVYAGVPTATTNLFTQREYAQRSPARAHPDAITALLAAVHQYGSQLTLLAIGPLFNVAQALDRDPDTMHQLGKIVLMGGSIRQGYHTAQGHRTPPAAEWNIAQDPAGANTIFDSGIPLAVFPLDSTQIALDQTDRERLFAAHTALTSQLHALYQEWRPHSWNHSPSPILFDAVAASSILAPQLCPTRPMRIVATSDGFTQVVSGAANTQVCLHADRAAFLRMLEDRLAPETPPRRSIQ